MIPAETLRLYDELVATRPGLERRGKTMPYTSINGHMCSFLDPDGTLALRLPEADRAAFLEKYATTLVEQHGHLMKEYVSRFRLTCWAGSTSSSPTSTSAAPRSALWRARSRPVEASGAVARSRDQKMAPTQDTSSQMIRITPMTTPSRMRPMDPRTLRMLQALVSKPRAGLERPADVRPASCKHHAAPTHHIQEAER